MILEARDVVAAYRSGQQVLHGVSCRVEPGSLLALVGPNGAGKTTLVRVLLGTLPPDTGHVTLDGRPLSDWTRVEVARAIGVVGQREEPAFPLRVEDTVMLGRYPWLGALEPPGPADCDAVERALERADVVALRARPTDLLSGGEWQRVRLARALAQEPRLLVLDEPTASLDVRHQMEAFELVRKLADQGLGALVVTHELNLAARFADRMLLLDRGRVAAGGTPGEVLQVATVSRTFAWPVAVSRLADGSPQVVPLRSDDPRSRSTDA
ncbi:MAG: ABC transporter ATP-binding protein [Gemmatimonadales bacterium]